ncbi:MAG: hypothetical protein JSS44_09915 [Proteobacteria bacterium]|nr:hypothetical protein [Pseudomonadota bacterium]MBS0462346.1 hypothetical protein [Pseudomonadota bacterium]MBS0464155.1 hypothetical protein [Pseudomonadota bacterium]
MKTRTFLRLCLLGATLALVACGNKGPLVLPDKATAPATDHPSASPASDTAPASPAG